MLQINDGTGDVACAVALGRSGNGGSFTTGDGSLDASAEIPLASNNPKPPRARKVFRRPRSDLAP